MMKSSSIVWFKNDLRLNDNETLCKAVANGAPLLPVFIFDERLYKTLSLGFRKADYNRFLFLKQSVENLKENFKKINGNLLIRYGIPEKILPQLVKNYNVSTIYAEQEYAFEELQVLERLILNLNNNCKLDLTWGKTLYHKEDIPYTIDKIPATSKAYRINTAKKAKVRAPFLAPHSITRIDNFPKSNIPSIKTFGLKEQKNVKPFITGGEDKALERLHFFTFKTQQLSNYRYTRNLSLGMNYSSKFSPYLAVGCMSPRLIYHKIKDYETLVKKNQSTWWLIFELVWRDFFTFKGMQKNTLMFKTKGFKNKERHWENNTEKFNRWCSGKTGIPFIDAHMRQLNTTGFMSNRGRVNCSSFLVYDYNINWTWGAAYFESKLIDYDVSANWMNWHYQAFEIWYTNPINQSIKYKAKAFIQTYVEELSHINDNSIYIPWEYGVKNYPKPVHVFSKWTRAINKIKKSVQEDGKG